MRIAVIGGGGAGLTAAWLLEEQHDVTLFERDDRLGGHAHTIDVVAGGERLAVDVGFQFFGAGPRYATFNRLLDSLGVERTEYSATMSLTRRGRSVALPPWRNGRPVWGSLRPSALVELARFRAFLARVPAFVERHDTTVTIAQYLEDQRMPRAFVDDFVLPFLLALWCVEPDELLEFAAYNVLYYLAESLSGGFRPPTQLQIAGGMRTYVAALERDLQRTEVRVGAGVTGIRRQENGFVIDGSGTVFDQVVVATSAEQAAVLVADIAPDLRTQLERIEYFDTTIAVHGDARLMPADRSAWSVVNTRWDGVHSHLSVWGPDRASPVFRSWTTFDERMPEPLYETVTYRHGKITVDYFDAQRRIKDGNGAGGVWIAGLYADDADSHESAVRSAVAVAERLAPGSARLRELRG